ncbi:MAG: HAMP domain-containing histidine kinase [Marinobacterium sp.]|nr:HAMP domain-containing histidine kinase [Marinobacterium sp.]
MKLNYTRRIALEMGLYSFLISLMLVLILWVVYEIYGDVAGPDSVENFSPHIEKLIANGNGESFEIDNLEFYIPPATIPAQLAEIKKLGTSKLDEGHMVFVGLHPNTGQRYYIVIDRRGGGDIEEYEWTGFITIAIGLLITTLITGLLAWRMTRRLVEPVLHLKQQIDQVTDTRQPIPVIDRDDEIGELSLAFQQMLERLQGFVEREKDFTRFASHELRSPVTVMQGNLELLEALLPETPMSGRVMTRMNTATRRMNLIIDSFLWLGREQGSQPQQRTLINLLMLEEMILELKQGYAESDWQRFEIHTTPLQVELHAAMFSLLLENLCRNALRHSQGSIRVVINPQGLYVENPLPSGNHRKSGDSTGIGLQIVERICQHNSWQLSIEQTSGIAGRFRVSVLFK